jgi:hypothetical protein
MSDGDQVLEDDFKQKNQPELRHYIQAAGEVIEEFRQYLVEETDRQTRVRSKQLGRDYQFGEALAQLDPAMHAHLHKLRMAADNFMNVLMGNY